MSFPLDIFGKSPRAELQLLIQAPCRTSSGESHISHRWNHGTPTSASVNGNLMALKYQIIRCSSWIPTKNEKASYNSIDIMLLNSEATSSLRDSWEFHFMTHEPKNKSSPTFSTLQVEVQGLCLEVPFWFDKGILNLFFFVAFLVAVQGQQALLRKVCLANSRGGLAEKVENVGKKSKNQIWCKKNQPHLDLATCEAWVNSTNIEACRRMMVSWRRCQMVFEASKQYGSREAGGTTTQIVQKKLKNEDMVECYIQIAKFLSKKEDTLPKPPTWTVVVYDLCIGSHWFCRLDFAALPRCEPCERRTVKCGCDASLILPDTEKKTKSLQHFGKTEKNA